MEVEVGPRAIREEDDDGIIDYAIALPQVAMDAPVYPCRTRKMAAQETIHRRPDQPDDGDGRASGRREENGAIDAG
jgi:hypothetical protein